MKRALITGITGQDGSYPAELLCTKGHGMHGMVRRSSTEKFERIEHLRDRITLHQGDLLDERSLVDALRAAQPSAPPKSICSSGSGAMPSASSGGDRARASTS